jgi:hypothetical protein
VLNLILFCSFCYQRYSWVLARREPSALWKTEMTVMSSSIWSYMLMAFKYVVRVNVVVVRVVAEKLGAWEKEVSCSQSHSSLPWDQGPSFPGDTPQKCHFTLGFCMLNVSIAGCPQHHVNDHDKIHLKFHRRNHWQMD